MGHLGPDAEDDAFSSGGLSNGAWGACVLDTSSAFSSTRALAPLVRPVAARKA